MRIRQFNLLLGIVLLLVALATSFLLYGLLIRPGLLDKLRDQQLSEMNAIRAGIGVYSQPLTTFSYSYAVWDEMVTFSKSPSEKFIATSLDDEAFRAAEMDGAYLYDTAGKLLWSFQGLPDLLPTALSQEALWFGPVLPGAEAVASRQPSNRSGILRYGNRVMFFSNSAVLPTKGSGEVTGSFMVVRIVNDSLTAMLRELTLAETSLSLAHPVLHNYLHELKTPLSIDKAAPSHSWLIRDVFGVPALVLSVVHSHNEFPAFFSGQSLLVFLMFILILLIASVPVTLLVLTPILKINQSMINMASQGRIIKIDKSFFIEELNRFVGTFNQLAERLEQHQHYLESLSLKDPLTGIANRRGLTAFATRAHQEWREGKGALGFLMMDVDEFKLYNDTQGHAAGDRTLLSVAQALLSECRRRSELVVRYGGEEFCVVVQEANTAQMEQMAERMLLRVRQLAIAHPHSHAGHVTVSIGAALFGSYDSRFGNIDWHEMLAQADKQLYRAKSDGRDRLCVLVVTPETEAIKADQQSSVSD